MYAIAAIHRRAELRTLAHEIADDVRQRIELGKYEPGSPLRQEEIAGRLGVSRIPVRDALRQLEQDGIVDIRANQGAYVVHYDLQAVGELFDVRLMLETDLLQRACGKLSDDALQNIETVNALLSTARTRREWITLDEEFHFMIYEAAERPNTLSLARTLRRSLNAYYLRYLEPDSRKAAWHREHISILRHVRRVDPMKATIALKEHLHGTRKVLTSALRQAGAGHTASSAF